MHELEMYVCSSFENETFLSDLNFFNDIFNDGCLAMGEGTTEKISEFQVGIKPRTSVMPATHSYHCKNS